jgi:hypothetical protein
MRSRPKRQPMVNLPLMLPDTEIDTLLTLVDDAIALAAAGQLADGYLLLLAGLHYAEAQREEGEPWAEELVERYRLAVENYCTGYGVRMG